MTNPIENGGIMNCSRCTKHLSPVGYGGGPCAAGTAVRLALDQGAGAIPFSEGAGEPGFDVARHSRPRAGRLMSVRRGNLSG